MVTKKNYLKKDTVTLSYTKIEHTKKSFIRMIEKRVRKDIRINKKVKEKFAEILNDGSKEFLVAKVLLNSIFGKHLTLKETKKPSKKTLIPTNLDREIITNLNKYFENKEPKHENNKILNNLLEEEIIIFCRIKDIKIGKKEKKNSLINNISNRYPETKFALAKSFEKIFP